MEATLLSARPVVPLEEIKAGKRLGKRLTFGIALICALLLGALGAKFIYRSGEPTTPVVTATPRGEAVSIDETAKAPSIVEGGAGGMTVSYDAATVEQKSVPLTPVNDELVRKEVRRQKSTPQPSAERGLREQRSAERRFEQERQRDQRREVRGRPRRAADGLSKIREIFEGPTRP